MPLVSPIMDFRLQPGAGFDPSLVRSATCQATSAITRKRCGLFTYRMIPGERYQTVEVECLYCGHPMTVH